MVPIFPLMIVRIPLLVIPALPPKVPKVRPNQAVLRLARVRCTGGKGPWIRYKSRDQCIACQVLGPGGNRGGIGGAGCEIACWCKGRNPVQIGDRA